MTAWAKRHDPGERLCFTPYQEAPDPPVDPTLRAACSQAVHIITPEGRILRAGRAVLVALDVLGWHALARILSRRPLIWLVEWGYRLVAGHRGFFGRFLFRS